MVRCLGGKANDIDIAKCKYSVEEKLKMIDFNCDLFRCKDVTCVQHVDILENVYEDVLVTCVYILQMNVFLK